MDRGREVNMKKMSIGRMRLIIAQLRAEKQELQSALDDSNLAVAQRDVELARLRLAACQAAQMCRCGLQGGEK
jgi:hypothetical protein